MAVIEERHRRPLGGDRTVRLVFWLLYLTFCCFAAAVAIRAVGLLD